MHQPAMRIKHDLPFGKRSANPPEAFDAQALFRSRPLMPSAAVRALPGIGAMLLAVEPGWATISDQVRPITTLW